MRSGTSVSTEILPATHPITWAGVLLPTALAGVLAIGGDAVRLALRYERHLAGAFEEPWRLLSAHLVHMNPSHLLLDGAGLLLVWALFAGRLPVLVWASAFLASCLSIDALLYLAHPEIGWYVGLSGVLHGLFAAGALWTAWTRDPLAWWLLAGLVVKLSWEGLVGPVPWSVSASRGPVVEVAHSYGAIGGTLALVGVLTLSARCRCHLRRQRERA